MNQMGRGFGQEARNLGETYKKETKRVLKNIKKEYGIDITPTPVKDEFGQEFYEIELNNDTRKIQEVLKYNTGGSVKAGSTPLMNLKYT
jgi:NifB/MoaA-like Fe-S oxidoreductase